MIFRSARQGCNHMSICMSMCLGLSFSVPENIKTSKCNNDSICVIRSDSLQHVTKQSVWDF